MIRPRRRRFGRWGAAWLHAGTIHGDALRAEMKAELARLEDGNATRREG